MKYSLKLYVAGEMGSSTRAVENLKRLSEDLYADQHSIEIVDIIKNPDLAAEEHVIATPVLRREFPKPVCQVIGDLSNYKSVIHALGIMEISKG